MTNPHRQKERETHTQRRLKQLQVLCLVSLLSNCVSRVERDTHTCRASPRDVVLERPRKTESGQASDDEKISKAARSVLESMTISTTTAEAFLLRLRRLLLLSKQVVQAWPGSRGGETHT